MGRNHDLLGNDMRLLHRSQNISAHQMRSRFHRRDEMPDLLPAQCRNLDSPCKQVGIRLLHDLYQRPLDPIINASDESGAELYAQRRSR